MNGRTVITLRLFFVFFLLFSELRRGFHRRGHVPLANSIRHPICAFCIALVYERRKKNRLPPLSPFKFIQSNAKFNSDSKPWIVALRAFLINIRMRWINLIGTPAALHTKTISVNTECRFCMTQLTSQWRMVFNAEFRSLPLTDLSNSLE